jgi:two-component system response regulator NreC
MDGPPADQRIITLVLADDHIVVRTGLRLVLERTGDLHVLSEAGDAESAVRKVRGHKPDVLLLDLNMPGELSSLEAIPQIAEASPHTRIVMLTMEEQPEFARRALQAGASGYVLKQAMDGEVLDAIRQVADGGTYLNPRLGAALALQAAGADGPPDDMTRRELDVLRLVALGHTNTEMAEHLHLSPRTVESHRSSVQRKLGRSSRAELVRYALDHGLLDDDGS